MTVNQIATRYDVHPNLVAQWKQQAIKQMPELFARPSARAAEDDEQLKAQLYQQIGQLKVELDWLKKKLDRSVDEKRRLIEPDHSQLSLSRQCQLLGLARRSFYYQLRGESEENLHLMCLLDEQYTRTPF